MRKLVKQYGDSAVVVLTKEDLKVYDMKVGDTIHVFTDESLEEVGDRFEKAIIEDIKERVDMDKAIDKRNKERFEEHKKSLKKAKEIEAKDKLKEVKK